MRKITFLVLALFLIAKFCFAQENGVVTYTITHDWIKKHAACKYISKTETEHLNYVWGGDNEYVRKAELKFNADFSRFEAKENDENTGYSWRKAEDYIIYRDRGSNETFDFMTLLNKQYAIKDSIVSQKWKIKNDIKEVAGRICMNASYYDTLKEKEVMVWFALDLPIPLGPDIYCGLPGMILEVNEGNGAVVYTATTILLSDEKVEIEKPLAKKQRKVITTQEYNNIISKHIAECKKMQRTYFGAIPF